MKHVTVKYGIGYGSHVMGLEFDDDASDEDIAADVEQAVLERVDWSWEVEPAR